MKKININQTENSIMMGLQEALSYAEGNTKAKKHVIKVSSIDVHRARAKLGLTQKAFASTFGVSISTIQNWEQGRRTPSGAAKVLLNVIEISPDTVKQALYSSSH
jgi:putative transcriptional regulator